MDQDGKERSIEALDARTWEVDTTGATSLTVRYDLDVHDAADEGAPPVVHVHSPAAFLYVEEYLDLPHHLRFVLPTGWDHASGHRPHPELEGVFYSPNYDVFVDCPIVVGRFERHGFELHDRPIEVVLWGKLPTEEQFPRAEWVEKVRRICDAAYGVVGDFPFERYVFLFGFTDIGGGYGLEHLNSTTIEFNHRSIEAGRVQGLESVTAHEFFHLWNVKRIRPEVLGPFDYSTDARTKDLWWMEGVTSYYTDVILQRAGLRPDPDWFLRAQAANLGGMMGLPAYGEVSPERSSWTVWDGRQQISYYDQGQALGFLMDVLIRHHTGNRRSLDDVVRFLHRWVDYPDRGLRPDDLRRAVRAVTGWDCDRFFDHYVRGSQRFPFAEVLPLAGIEVVAYQPGDPYLGLPLDDELRLSRDLPETAPPLERGDHLVRVDGKKVKSSVQLRELVAGLTPGESVELRFRRKGQELVVDWKVKERNRGGVHFVPRADADDAARAILRGILEGIPEGV